MGMRMTDDLDGALDALRQAEPLAQGASLISELGELHYLRGSLHFPRGELDLSGWHRVIWRERRQTLMRHWILPGR